MITTVAAALALVVALAGIHGVMAYGVSRRTHEFGVRLALGASPPSLERRVLGQGFWTTGAGILIGLLVATGVARVLEGSLFGVDALDPTVFTTVGIMVGVAALVATWVPARRATRHDLVEVLRME